MLSYMLYIVTVPQAGSNETYVFFAVGFFFYISRTPTTMPNMGLRNSTKLTLSVSQHFIRRHRVVNRSPKKGGKLKGSKFSPKFI